MEYAALTTGVTWDEPKYVAEGQGMVSTGWFPVNPVPLAGFGIAQHIGGERTVPDGAWLEWPVPAAQRDLRVHLARQATIVISLIGALATAGMVGGGAGLLAHALWALSPTLLSNGCLASLDVWVASWSACAAWAITRSPTRRGALLTGVFVALAGGSKIVGFGALLYPLLRVPGQWRPMLLATAAATWAVHGFAVDAVDVPGIGPVTVPAPLLVGTFTYQIDHIFLSGHPVPSLPESSPADPLFYARLLLWKLPVTTLALMFFRRPDPRLIAWPVVLFVLCSTARTQLGLRYMLPAAPYVIAWLATAASPWAWLLWAVGAVRVLLAPPWLTWNERLLGTRDDALRAGVEGSDWCQDQAALVDWLAENPAQQLYYSGCGNAPPAGLPRPYVPCAPTPGTYAIHALDLYRPTSRLPACLSWLPLDDPEVRVGDTILIWRVP